MDGPSEPGSRGRYDRDDLLIVDFGKPAESAETHAVMTLVSRYYAAAASDNGAAVCALMYSTLAEAVPESYGRSPGPPQLRGKTCEAVMSKFFRPRRKLLTAERKELSLRGVRVQRNAGFALVRFKGGPLHYVHIRREHGAWKINTFLDGGLD